jgi:hypothetical protein
MEQNFERTVKFTNDGRKVAVLDKLNSDGWIVQEIFVAGDGSEILSGKNFIEKSLHDALPVSWKESKLKELEKRYEREKDEWERRIKKQDEEVRRKYAELYAITKALQEMASHLKKPESRLEFVRFLDFLSGGIKWVVINEYNVPQIAEFSEHELCCWWNGRCDGLKLVTLFGRSDGSLNYRINTYMDGSGSGKDVYPFASYEEAFDKFKELVLSKDVNEKVIETAKKYSIVLDREKVSQYYAKQESYLTKEIGKSKENMDNMTARLEALKREKDDAENI